MSRDEKLDRLHEVLVADWALPEEVRPTIEEFLAALAGRVRELLERDLNRLTTAMYTLDIDEERFGTAMHLPGIEMQCMGVAELILARELQKVESRMQYEAMKRREQEGESADPLLGEDRPPIELG